MDETSWGIVHFIKWMFPDVQFLILFDKSQCPTVPHRPDAHTEVLTDCHFVKHEIASMWVEFTEIYRSRCPRLTAACKLAAQGKRVRQTNASDLGIEEPSVVCWTNATRKKTNQQFSERCEGKPLPRFETQSLKYPHEKLQDFQFRVGMPLICIKTQQPNPITGFWLQTSMQIMIGLK